MSSPETIVYSHESGATGQYSLDSEPTSTRPQRRKRKRSHLGSCSPTPNEESDIGDDNTARRPKRNIPTSKRQQRTSKRPQRRSRKRVHLSSRSPTRNEESDTGEASTEATRPERNITGMAIPNTPLLSNLEKHPSANARAGQSVSTQNLNFRGAWPTAVELYREAHDSYKELFSAAGFSDFLSINAMHIPQGYALALTERWFSETNTVHLPSFEIGPTPVDWAMITGLRFGGQCIILDPNYDWNRALEVLGAEELGGEEKVIADGKICLKSIQPNMEEVKAAPTDDERKGKIFRRLFLYIIGSCFFSNNRSVINHGLVKFVERIDAIHLYDWGAITYAAFLTGMRRKVTGETGAFTGFWPFLVLWAFEYLDISRPELTGEDFPRAVRWKCPQNQLGPLEEVIKFRCRLNYLKKDQVTWQPYLGSARFHSDAISSAINLAKKRVPFQSLHTWEYYLGERCRRQMGLPCRVPLPPPENMHGTSAVNPEDAIGLGKSAETLVMDETENYDKWFAQNSIGKIVDVNELLGGTKIATEVLDDWMAKYLPDMKLVPKSEDGAPPEAADPARDAAVPGAADPARDAAVPDAADPARDTADPTHDTAAIAECSENQDSGRARTDS